MRCMERVSVRDAYAYVPYMGQQQHKRQKKKENKGFETIMKKEIEKMGYTLDLTREELLMVIDALEERKEAPYYDWQSKLMDSVNEKIERIYQKPVMTEGEVAAKYREVLAKWPEDKSTGTFLANLEQARLYFAYRVMPC